MPLVHQILRLHRIELKNKAGVKLLGKFILTPRKVEHRTLENQNIREKRRLKHRTLEYGTLGH